MIKNKTSLTGYTIWTEKLEKHYRYGSVQINSLPPVNLKVKDGEAVTIKGKNGSGKSTLLKILATLITPSSGSCYINGKNIINEASQIRNHLGYIPEKLHFDYSLTGRKLWHMMTALRGVKQDKDYFHELADNLGIKSWLEKPVGTYSAGMQKRYMTAMWLSLKPDILLLDELDASLDQNGLGLIRDLMSNIDNLTIISVSHLDKYTITKDSRIIQFETLIEGEDK